MGSQFEDGNARFTRLTSGFSKKVENHAAAIAIHYCEEIADLLR